MADKNNDILQNETRFTAKDAGLAYTLAVIFYVAFSLIFPLFSEKAEAAFGNDFVFYLRFFIAPVSIATAILFFKLRFKPNAISLLKPKKAGNSAIIGAILIFLGVMLGFSDVNAFFISLFEKAGYEYEVITLPDGATFKNVTLCIVFLCLFPTVAEEILMRGIISEGLRETGIIFALAAGGVTFSLFHLSPQQTVYQFIVGASFTLIAIRGGNWCLTAAGHFLNNLIVVISEYFFKDFVFPVYIKIPLVTVGLISFFAGAFIYLKKVKKDEFKGEPLKIKDFAAFAAAGVIICAVLWVSQLATGL